MPLAEWEYSEKPAKEQLLKMGYEYKSNHQLNLERDAYNQGLLLKRLNKAIKKSTRGLMMKGLWILLHNCKNLRPP
jgi:hypothetical protein